MSKFYLFAVLTGSEPRLNASLDSSATVPLTTTPSLFSIPIEFLLFGLLLLGVALFHKHILPIALSGLGVIIAYKFLFTPLNLIHHLGHEWLTLVNLLGLLVGFAILASYFEKSGLPSLLPDFLPNDWKGGAVLIVTVALLSTFLDNIAAAVIGGTIAYKVYHGKVHLAFVAALVAASNAGGAGSVIGDTTTTMMWIDGIAASQVLHAFLGSIPCVLIVAIFGGLIQHKHQPIQKDATPGEHIHWKYFIASMLIIIGVIAANVFFDLPAAGVWAAILISVLFVKLDLEGIPNALKGAIFLLSLVFAASMMPVENLPEPSWLSALMLGFVSAFFDNIPLTKLALAQGGYDWGVLAYAVGFGGSMVWFGSSAGVAITSIFPHARSAGGWVSQGWFVILAYIVGFASLILLWGWHP